MSDDDDMDARAERHARTHPLDPKWPAHWLRCTFVTSDDRRCIKGSDHTDQHEFPKPTGATHG